MFARRNPCNGANLSMNHARIETIINYYALADGLVSGGQPTPEEFTALRDAGFQVLINLVPPDADMALANERKIIAALGMEYIHIPVIWDAPQVSDAQTFFDAMQSHRAKHVFVHCEVNYRASAFLYLYRRKYLGVDERQARQDLQWIWEPNATWKQFIEMVMTLE
jgi:protein tyrosine phosphatase (PTP) superfamily phosphohydrolase (DUF442 family)